MQPAKTILADGGYSDPNKLELHERANRRKSKGYIALSHCWGTPMPEEKKRFCTTGENYNQLEEFNYNGLPR